MSEKKIYAQELKCHNKKDNVKKKNEHESKCNNNVEKTLVKNKMSQHYWVKTE